VGKSRRQGNTTLQNTNNNSIEDLVENEGNEYSVADPSKMMINMSNELNEGFKESLKGELKNEFKEELIEELQETLKENIQKQLKEYQDNTKNL
jgi:chromosome condensin MukBEF complex kleisin-like MukF subunit